MADSSVSEFTVLTDASGNRAFLTTNSSMSWHGAPILRIESENICGDFGPADLIGGGLLAAEVVQQWADEPGRTEAELRAARLFLSGWTAAGGG